MKPYVYVESEKIWGTPYWRYRVIVEHIEYDEITTTTNLTWAQQSDMANEYAQALDGYTMGGMP